jgi:hypothetical protein
MHLCRTGRRLAACARAYGNMSGRDLSAHVGIVHAAMRSADGSVQAEAAPVYDAAAAFV